ncbi:MAG: C1 family peptidase [Candidatus Pacearchaeota archaeon]
MKRNRVKNLKIIFLVLFLVFFLFHYFILIEAKTTRNKINYLTSINNLIKNKNYFIDYEKLQYNYELAEIQKKIKEKNLSWQAGETEVSKLPKEQRKKLLSGIIEVKDIEKSEEEQINNFDLKYYENSLPSSFDWRNKDGVNWMTPVKNQFLCGSCWAFADVGVIEAAFNIYQNNPDLDLDLSEQDVISCSGYGSCGGGTAGGGLLYAINTGIVNETCFPYTATNNNCSNKCYNGEKYKIKGRFNYGFYNHTNEYWKSILMKYGPGTVLMYAPDDFLFYIGGIYEPLNDEKSGYANHAVVLVGWNDTGFNETTNMTEGYWIVKNSWGTYWGENGYGKIKYGIIESYRTFLVVTGIINGSITCSKNSDCGIDNCYNGTYKKFSCINPDTEYSYCSSQDIITDNDLDGYDIQCEYDCDDNDSSKWQILNGYLDYDKDNYGAGDIINVCSGNNLPLGYSYISGDCNDNDSSIYPNAQELCDEKDNDCNFLIDEIFLNKGKSCDVGVGFCKRTGIFICSSNGLETICNVIPGDPKRELCFNEIDDDCDGEVDEEDCGIKGDINDDSIVDISDVILTLRMAIELNLTIRGNNYEYPYPDWLINKADINDDKVIDIYDTILILRISLGLNSEEKLTESQIPSFIKTEIEKKGMCIDDIKKIK